MHSLPKWGNKVHDCGPLGLLFMSNAFVQGFQFLIKKSSLNTSIYKPIRIRFLLVFVYIYIKVHFDTDKYVFCYNILSRGQFGNRV